MIAVLILYQFTPCPPGSEVTLGVAENHADVLEALRRLEMTAIRYPGGDFVPGYDWRDGIGPRAERPQRLEKA
jgi:hypothetical protein